MAKRVICIICFLISIVCHAQYKNLVFEGGGIRGIAYTGAVNILEKKGVIQGIEKVGGTSAGSIVALMICLGYTSKEIDSIIFNLKIEKFNDGRGGLLGKYRRMKKNYGIYKGDRFGEWLEQLINYKTGNPFINFKQLDSLASNNSAFKKLYCVGANLTKQKAEIFSFETTPSCLLKTAIRISCSIPFYYRPVLLDSNWMEIKNPVKGYYYQVYVDGGIVTNYPINLFDSCKKGENVLFCDTLIYNKQTLGIKLERNEQIDHLSTSWDIPPINIRNFNDYSGAFLNLVMETINRKPNLQNERGRTIYIGYGNIFPKPRKMTSKEKLSLFESGKVAAEQFFLKTVL